MENDVSSVTLFSSPFCDKNAASEFVYYSVRETIIRVKQILFVKVYVSRILYDSSMLTNTILTILTTHCL